MDKEFNNCECNEKYEDQFKDFANMLESGFRGHMVLMSLI